MKKPLIFPDMEDREEESFFKELAELVNHALNEKGYEFPFTALVVGANCYVLGLEFLKDGVPPNTLYEKSTGSGTTCLCPVTLFFYCEGRAPFYARINGLGDEAICRSNTVVLKSKGKSA